MSPKKVHEVLTMAQLVGAVCKEEKINEVVDIGAGEGYISHMLAKIFNLKVTAVEANEKIIASGKNRIQTADYWMQHRKEKHSEFNVQNKKNISLKDKISQMPLSIEFLHFVCSWGNLKEFEEKLSHHKDFALVGYFFTVSRILN